MIVLAIAYALIARWALARRQSSPGLPRGIAIALLCAFIVDAMWRRVLDIAPCGRAGTEAAVAAELLFVLCATGDRGTPSIPRCAIVRRWGTSFRS